MNSSDYAHYISLIRTKIKQIQENNFFAMYKYDNLVLVFDFYNLQYLIFFLRNANRRPVCLDSCYTEYIDMQD